MSEIWRGLTRWPSATMGWPNADEPDGLVVGWPGRSATGGMIAGFGGHSWRSSVDDAGAVMGLRQPPSFGAGFDHGAADFAVGTAGTSSVAGLGTSSIEMRADTGCDLSPPLP